MAFLQQFLASVSPQVVREAGKEPVKKISDWFRHVVLLARQPTYSLNTSQNSLAKGCWLQKQRTGLSFYAELANVFRHVLVSMT